MGELLEEQIPVLDKELFQQNKTQAQLHYNHPGQPVKMYTIEYLKGGKLTSWACMAHDFYWKDRHKVFYCVDAGGTKHEVAEFYCSAKDFVAQKARRVFRSRLSP